jgi:hypothetical protein
MVPRSGTVSAQPGELGSLTALVRSMIGDGWRPAMAPGAHTREPRISETLVRCRPAGSSRWASRSRRASEDIRPR